MAMSGKTADGELAMEINTTPLIDIMLVLLTLLIITLPPQTHAVTLDMPHTVPPPDRPPPVVNLAIDFDGTLYWDQAAVDRATLDSYFVQSLSREPQPEIHVRPSALAKYNVVAQVLGDAQRLGVTRIGFVGIDQ